MRIRKNASRILSSSSPPAAAAPPLLPPPPKPSPVLLPKCELNQSPWDVMSFPLPPSSPQKMGNDGIEKDTSVKTTRTNRKRAVSRKSTVIKEEAADHNEARADSGGSTVPTCKKMDGKKWKCKKAAKLPRTLCEYHLTQLKSYSRVDGVLPPRDSRPRSKKRQKVSSAAAGSDTGFYYYYSGFGPWRGKKRGDCGGASSNVTVKEEGQEDRVQEKEEEGVRVQENVDDDDAQDSLEDHSEEEDAMQQQQISNPRRRRRRKARSLKSLL